MEQNPGKIIETAREAGLVIDAPVMAIEALERPGAFRLVLYNGKQLEVGGRGPGDDAAARGARKRKDEVGPVSEEEEMAGE